MARAWASLGLSRSAMYRRLEKLGLLSSRWEDPGVAATEQRPLRRLYQITAAGETAAEAAAASAPMTESTNKLKKGLAAS